MRPSASGPWTSNGAAAAAGWLRMTGIVHRASLASGDRTGSASDDAPRAMVRVAGAGEGQTSGQRLSETATRIRLPLLNVRHHEEGHLDVEEFAGRQRRRVLMRRAVRQVA